MHRHCTLAWLQLIWGYVEWSICYWVCIHFWTWHSLAIKTVNFLKQGKSRTYYAASQTGPLREVFKDGTCFSTLLSQDGQEYWASVPARLQSFAPVSLLRASGSGTFQDLKRENLPSWTKKLVIVYLSGEALDPFIKEAVNRVELPTQFSVQRTTWPWFDRLFPVFLWCILI